MDAAPKDPQVPLSGSVKSERVLRDDRLCVLTRIPEGGAPLHRPGKRPQIVEMLGEIERD